MVVGGLGRQKMVVSSYVHMLICSSKLFCEHLFTFQFYALMPKISKENFAYRDHSVGQLTAWLALLSKISVSSRNLNIFARPKRGRSTPGFSIFKRPFIHSFVCLLRSKLPPKLSLKVVKEEKIGKV